MRRFIPALLPLLCVSTLLTLPTPVVLAQYNKYNSQQQTRSDTLWENTWKEFDYWLKRLDTNNLVVNWEKRYGERWVRVYVNSERWNAEPDSNRRFLTRALNLDTRWPLAVQDEQYNILALEGLSSQPKP